MSYNTGATSGAFYQASGASCLALGASSQALGASSLASGAFTQASGASHHASGASHQASGVSGQYADPTPRYALIIRSTSVKPVSYDMKRKYMEFELPRLTKTIVPESCGLQNWFGKPGHLYC